VYLQFTGEYEMWCFGKLIDEELQNGTM